jgi:two-component system, cell cycle sensor histidine kinase and response regulator CckA
VNAIEYASIGMMLVEPERKFHRTNKAFCEMTGYSNRELSEMNFLDITHPDDYDIGLTAKQHLIEGRIERASLEKRYLNKDTSVIDVYLTTSFLRDFKGSPIYFFSQVQDITARKHPEHRVEHLNRVLRAIRDVNQLIVRERDPQALFQEGCRLLVENRGYASALIVLTDENGRLHSWVGSGVASSCEALNAMLERQKLLPCYDIVKSGRPVLVIDDRSSVCGQCPIVCACTDIPSLCVDLTHEDKAFG